MRKVLFSQACVTHSVHGGGVTGGGVVRGCAQGLCGQGVCVTSRGVGWQPPPPQDTGIQSMRGRYASY